MNEYKNFKIIIIDDNKDIHQDFIKILSFNEPSMLSEVEQKLFGDASPKDDKLELPHFQIDSALQGQEGFQRIKKAFKEGEPYALAFVDVRMPPGWDGIQTIKHVWEIDPEIQIVICTAYSDYSWEETIRQLGKKESFLIIKKPFDAVSVRQLAFALTKKWQLLQEKRNGAICLQDHIEKRTSSLQTLLSISKGMLDTSIDGVLIISKDNTVVDYNTKLLEICSIPQCLINPAQGSAVLDYISKHVEDPNRFSKMMTDLSKKTNMVSVEKFTFSNDRIFECYSQPYMRQNIIAGRIWSFRDVTEQIIFEKKLEYQATHDGLTGLPNRVLLLDRLHQMIIKAKRHHSIFAIIFFDLDRFKLINDSLGHNAGDALLNLIAKRLTFMLRKSDTLARLGGDEFVLIVDGFNNELNVGVVANHLLESFKNVFNIAGQSLTVSASAGISIYPRDGTTISELLRNADTAMYKAKNQGTNQFQFYTAEIGEQIIGRLALEHDLHHALLNNELELNYQPEFDVKRKEISSIEALIRWNHPQKGLLLPIHFIPVAEDTGLIVPIGEWVLKTACAQNKKWQDEGFPHMRVVVSLSAKQVIQPDLVQTIKTILETTGLNPAFLEIEIAENVLIKTMESSRNIFSALTGIGVQTAVGNFGTEYSNIDFLRKIPLDRLKIDKSIVSHVNLNTSDGIIIQSIISLARQLNLEVVAEGVETQKQLAFLQSNHCEEVQGLYFSEPMTSSGLEKFLNDTYQ